MCSVEVNNGKESKLSDTKYHCRDCKHSYDWHEKDYKGEFFLCRCPFFKYSKFLNKDHCEHFELKRNGKTKFVNSTQLQKSCLNVQKGTQLMYVRFIKLLTPDY